MVRFAVLRAGLIGLAGVMGVAWVVGSTALAQITITEPEAALLPAQFGGWVRTSGSVAVLPSALASLSPQALSECGERRSKLADYVRGGNTVQVEALEFGDRTGAYSAFTLVEEVELAAENGVPGGEQGGETGSGKARAALGWWLTGLTVGKGLEAYQTAGAGAQGGAVVLSMVGKTLLLARFSQGTPEEDAQALTPLLEAMPKVFGSAAVVPVLPTLPPAGGLVAGSLRYALGPVSYAAEGGVLPPGSLDWTMEPEVVTVRYDDARGKETLTLVLFPTPTIAKRAAKTIAAETPELKSNARLRQQGMLVALATGGFSAAEAEQMVKGIHLSELAFNQDAHPPFKVVAAQAFTLLENIAILSGVLGAAAVLLGLFLGFGRAGYRVLRGKPPAVEMEFLSLHLAPQNKPAIFDPPERREDANKGGRAEC
ncbi:MAG: DUF6599 family protein [Acidobacteriota bacterium]